MRTLNERLSGVPECEQNDIVFDYIYELESKLKSIEERACATCASYENHNAWCNNIDACVGVDFACNRYKGKQ